MADTVVKKGKSPFFWMVMTSILWLVIMGICAGSTLAIISANKAAKEIIIRDVRIILGLKELENEIICTGEVNECLKEKQELKEDISELEDTVKEQEIIIEFLSKEEEEVTPTPTGTGTETPTPTPSPEVTPEEE